MKGAGLARALILEGKLKPGVLYPSVNGVFPIY
jgi:hypothetical protein